ncbi:hypothetical protein TUM17387_08840 [Shewanella carassii]|uniref:Uncharacterized protein n=1 Tax=Shewanella algae TaxID=38313 RepID=A0A7T8INX1_9GAMM|nr:hypothetical protein [Shewanella carassii]QQO82686.1 hypothetical protein D7032_05100 [Shewanella algae]BCV65525.1 hypothetical protein TUM17387_08840 [Shewanella carassii]
MSDNLLLIGFLVDGFFGLSPDDKKSVELFQAILNGLESNAPIVNGRVSNQVYFKKFRELCAEIGEEVIVSQVKKGTSVNDAAFMAGVSCIHAYRVCKKHKVRLLRGRNHINNGICDVLSKIDEKILSIMTGEGFTLNQARKEMDIINRSIFHISKGV